MIYHPVHQENIFKMTFKELKIGAYFDTKVARYLKVTDVSGVVVCSKRFRIGSSSVFLPEVKVKRLYDDVKDE